MEITNLYQPKKGFFKRFCVHGHDTYKTGRSRRGSCKVCSFLDNKQRVRSMKIKNPRCFQNYEWKRKKIIIDGHFFTLLDYDREYQKQSGCCKICGIHQVLSKGVLVVDHDHDTGLFRGLLCRVCNISLGHYEKMKTEFSKYLGKV